MEAQPNAAKLFGLACWVLGHYLILIGSATASAAQINVIFRVDDYSQITDWDREVRIIEAFRARTLPVCIAAVPFAHGNKLDGTRADYLREAIADGTVEIALHGCTHEAVSPAKPSTEFAGLSREIQHKKIQTGLAHLEAILQTPVKLFVPPFNTYDVTTLAVLRDCGVKMVSADYQGSHLDGMRFFPFTALLHELPLAIETARTRCPKDAEVYIIVLTHAYELTDDTPDTSGMFGRRNSFKFATLEQLLDDLTKQQDVTITRFANIPSSTGTASDFQNAKEQRAKQGPLLDSLNGLRRRYTPNWLSRRMRDYSGQMLTYPPPAQSIPAVRIVRVLAPTVVLPFLALLLGAGFGARFQPYWFGILAAGTLVLPIAIVTFDWLGLGYKYLCAATAVSAVSAARFTSPRESKGLS